MKKSPKINKTEAIYVMILLVLFFNYSDYYIIVFIISSIEKNYEKFYSTFSQRNYIE